MFNVLLFINLIAATANICDVPKNNMNIFQRALSFFNPHEPERIYSVEGADWFVHVLDWRDLNKLYKDNYPDKYQPINGFTLANGDIYIAYDYTQKDIDGEYLPRFETGFHEVWHKIKWKWHK